MKPMGFCYLFGDTFIIDRMHSHCFYNITPLCFSTVKVCLQAVCLLGIYSSSGVNESINYSFVDTNVGTKSTPIANLLNSLDYIIYILDFFICGKT